MLAPLASTLATATRSALVVEWFPDIMDRVACTRSPGRRSTPEPHKQKLMSGSASRPIATGRDRQSSSKRTLPSPSVWVTCTWRVDRSSAVAVHWNV